MIPVQSRFSIWVGFLLVGCSRGLPSFKTWWGFLYRKGSGEDELSHVQSLKLREQKK
jgi:hypothetical protein